MASQEATMTRPIHRSAVPVWLAVGSCALLGLLLPLWLPTLASASSRGWEPVLDLEPAGEDDEPEGDSEEAYAERYCAPQREGEQCGPGYGRQTAGGGEKVSHKGWPAVTGILWKVVADDGRRKVGGERNDELLGHHGSDRIAGADGHDIVWGDWDPKDNNTRQHDVLRGGSGNDWIYSSHGTNRIFGGKGRDYIWAYYGHGTIDCGPGKRDTARVRLNSGYRVRNCERIKNFCGHGSKPGGGCYKPGEKPAARRKSG